MSGEIERLHYRVVTPDDQAFIDDMNIVATFAGRMHDAELPETDSFLEDVEPVAVYSKNFGQPGDLGLIAQDSEGLDVAAVWAREYARTDDHVMKSHPFELTIAVREAVRGQGIGRQLLDSFATMAWLHGKDEISLGVHKKNQGARHLYESNGYIPLVDDQGAEGVLPGNSTPMVRVLQPERTLRVEPLRVDDEGNVDMEAVSFPPFNIDDVEIVT